MLALMAESSARSARPPLVGRPLSGRAVGSPGRGCPVPPWQSDLSVATGWLRTEVVPDLKALANGEEALAWAEVQEYLGRSGVELRKRVPDWCLAIGRRNSS